MHKKLAIFGCSFTADDDWKLKGYNLGWPSILGEIYDSDPLLGNILFEGKCGTSTWYAYQRFLWAINEHTIDRIVFGYTSTHRIPFLPHGYNGTEWAIAPQDINVGMVGNDEEFPYAIWTYQKYFFQEELNKFICNHVFNEVNRICEERNIQLVNIIPFDNDIDASEYSVMNSKFNTLIALDSISRKESNYKFLEYGERVNTGWKETAINCGVEYNKELDTRPCHFNFENNRRLATVIDTMFDLSLFDAERINLVEHPKFKNIWDFSKNTWQSWSEIPYCEN